MKKWLAFIVLAVVAIAAAVHGLSDGKHSFSKEKCILCHYDAQNEPSRIQPTVFLSCAACHSKIEQMKSHPVDVYPSMKVPDDMPLTDGKLTCSTCHYIHPRNDGSFFTEDKLLRRQVKGIFFCNVCHTIDRNKHIVMENIHPGSYTVTDQSTRIDQGSLECIECHDSYLNDMQSSLGAGQWKHFTKAFNHPIGADYSNVVMRRPRKFKSANMLNSSIRLYNGKIGCGTCHNIYSHQRGMLVMQNVRSRLCLECHNM